MPDRDPRAVTLGFHCSHEQHAPSTLLALAREAEAAGFAAAMCSDHFHPWSERQGHSGFTWAWLGSAFQATRLSFGTVCAPGQRYHPAVIAQAAATLAEMYPGRFWVAIGSGEALNEAITGEPWPPKPARQVRLRECAAILRALWAGETVSHRGHVFVEDARLYSRPAEPPLLVGAALTPETARFVGAWADALITVVGDRDDMRAIVDAFREGGGESKPLYLQVPLAFASDADHARRGAHDQWRHAVLSSAELADLRTPDAFDRATTEVTEAEVERRLRVSSDVERHVAWLQEDVEMGFSRLYLHNVVRDTQRQFLDACGERLVPAFATTPVGDGVA
jgi:coenzyme F420-dependent glucose-6-phosphate dehydrogenase